MCKMESNSQELLSHYILLSCTDWLLKNKTCLRNQNERKLQMKESEEKQYELKIHSPSILHTLDSNVKRN